jgi:hypothetical protein
MPYAERDGLVQQATLLLEQAFALMAISCPHLSACFRLLLDCHTFKLFTSVLRQIGCMVSGLLQAHETALHPNWVTAKWMSASNTAGH